jgi:WD40 repeat protein
MLRLAGPGEGDAIVRRRAPLSEFDVENPDVGKVLATLTTRRLVTVDEGTVEVAHEALLREWPRLRSWVEEDREGRRLRAHLIEAASGWEAGGEDAGELYRGARLATAIDWTAEHSLELNELERRFLAESRAATDRESARQRMTNRRLRGLLAGTALFLALALVAGALALVQRGRAEDAAVAARTAATAAERSAVEATAQRLGAQALVQKDLDLTLLLARQGTDLDDSVLTRGNLLAALVRSPAAIGIARPLPGRLLRVFADPKGAYLVVGSNGEQGAILDPVSLETMRTFDGTGFLVGDTLVSVQEGTFVRVDPATGETETLFQPPDPDWCTFGGPPDMSEIALGACDGSSITTYDTESAALLLTVSPDQGWTFADVWYSPDGRLLTLDHEGPFDPAAFADPIRFTVRDPNTGEVIASVPSPDGMVPYAFSPDGASLALARADGGITVHDLQSGGSRDLHGRHNETLNSLDYSPDGRTIVSTGDDNVAIVWDVETGDIRETLRGHNGRVFGPAFSPDGKTVYTVSLDGSLLAWDLAGDRRLGRPFDAGEGAPVGIDPVPAFDVSPDGLLLAVAQAGGTVDILDAATFEVLHTVEVGAPGDVLEVAFSPDGSLMATTGRAGNVLLWDTSSWTVEAGPLEVPSTPQGFQAFGTAITFSPDGSLLAVGLQILGPEQPDAPPDGASEVVLWDVRTRETSGEPLGLDDSLDALDVAFSPDGSLLAATMDVFQGGKGDLNGGYARVWSIGDRSERFTVDVDSGYGRAAAVGFSPDGSLLATGGGNGEVRFFGTAAGEKQGRSVLANAGWVESIDFSPDGRTLVTAGTDSTTRLIDLDARAVIGAPLPGDDQVLWRALFTPDGVRVITVSEIHEGVAWGVSPDQWNRLACGIAGRQLSREEWTLFLPDLDYDPACAVGS